MGETREGAHPHENQPATVDRDVLLVPKEGKEAIHTYEKERADIKSELFTFAETKEKERDKLHDQYEHEKIMYEFDRILFRETEQELQEIIDRNQDADEGHRKLTTVLDLLPRMARLFPHTAADIAEVILNDPRSKQDPSKYIETLIQLSYLSHTEISNYYLYDHFLDAVETKVVPNLADVLKKRGTASIERAAKLIQLYDAVSKLARDPDVQHKSEGTFTDEYLDSLEAIQKKNLPPLLKRKIDAILHREQSTYQDLPAEEKKKIMVALADQFLDLNEEEIIEFDTAQLEHEWQIALDEPTVRRAAQRAEFIHTARKREQKAGTQSVAVPGMIDAIRKYSCVIPVSKDYYAVFQEDRPAVAFINKDQGNHHLIEMGDMETFQERSTSTDEERTQRRQVLADYLALIDPDVLEGLEADFGFPVRDLTLREQVWLAAVLRNGDQHKERKLIAFTQRFGIDGARAFLAVSEGQNYEEYIFKIGDSLPKEMAGRIFSRFAEVSGLAQREASQIAREVLAEKSETVVDAAEIENNLMRRARGLLEEFYSVAYRAKAERKRPSERQFLEYLDRHRADIALFSSVFRAAAKDKRVDLADFRGLAMTSLHPNEIPSHEATEMLAIAKHNWEGQKSEVTESIVSGLAKKLDGKNTKSTFYILTKEKEVAAFIRFDERPNNTLYAASLNVSPELRGAAVGETMMRQTMDQQAQQHVIDADVFPELVAGTNYVEQQGFILSGTKVFRDEKGRTDLRFQIRRDDRRNGSYRLRKPTVSREALLAGKVRGARVERFDLSKGTSQMVAAVEDATAQHMVGTRYWHDPKNPNIRYIAFEPEVEPVELPEAAE